MFLEVGRCTGANAPLARWLQAPSVRTLVDSLTISPEPTSQPAATPQVFLIGWLFHVEAPDLGGAPCHVVPFPDNGETEATCTVRHLAEGCVRQLRTLRTRTPWIVVGYSLAGLVALEVARVMTAFGDAPGEVWMVDSVPPGTLHGLGVAAARRVGAAFGWPFRRQLLLARGLHSVAEVALPLRQFRVAEAWRRLRIELRRFWRLGRRSWIGRKSEARTRVSGEAEPVNPANHHPHIWANNGYHVQPHAGLVISFVTRGTQEDHPEPGNGWSPAITQLQVVPLPGDHASCIREHRGALVAGFRQRLERWVGGAPSKCADSSGPPFRSGARSPEQGSRRSGQKSAAPLGSKSR